MSKDVDTPPGLIDGADVRSRRFELFDVVLLRGELETGDVQESIVQIVGYCWNPQDSPVVDWWCHCRYVYQPHGFDAHLPLGYQFDCLESELVNFDRTDSTSQILCQGFNPSQRKL